MVMKNCIVCGKPFDARGKAKCCSPECSKINRRDKNREYSRKWCEANPEKNREYSRKWARANPEKNRESSRKWREANPEKSRENSRKWREANPEKNRENSRKWREANPEKHREYNRKWREANPEKNRESNRKWREANPEKSRENSRKWREANPEKSREISRKWYNNNRDEVIKKTMLRDKEIISELCDQYDGDLEQILENVPNKWQVREAKMRVWFNESYYDGMIAKINSTPVCEVSGEKTNDLVNHHLYSFNTHPELGADPNNMVRVRDDIHKKFHSIYGYGNNTPEQWFEFVENL